MKTMRASLAVWMFLMLVPAGISARAQQAPVLQGQEKPKPPLPNYVELTPLIGTGGQPGEGGLRELADKGYGVLVNIRAADEEYDRVGEEKLALQLGLQYFVIPFIARDPSAQQALAFHEIMTALKDSRVYVHCGSGNRVGSLMMIHLALEGMTPEKAEQEARKAGLRSADLVEFSKKVIGSHKK